MSCFFLILTFTITRVPEKFIITFLLTKHSHLRLSLFHFCLLLQTIESNLHKHIQFHGILFVLFYFFMRLDQIFFIIFGTHTLTYGLLILLQFPSHFNEFTPDNNVITNIFYKPKHFIQYHFLSLNKHEYHVFQSLKTLHTQH